MKQKEMGMPGSDTKAAPVVQYEGQQYPVKAGQSVLDALLEAQVRVPFSCRAGLCHACMMETTKADNIPAAARSGLSSEQIARGAFLACQCYPQQNLSVRRPNRQQQTKAIVTHITTLSPTIKALTVSPRTPLDYRPGQYMSVWKNKEECRDLSLVSLPEANNDITFHVERHARSNFSLWIHDELKPGDQLTVGNIRGDCHYHPGNPVAPLLLIGFDTGIGALYGILKDAIEQGHRGTIKIIHATTLTADLYLDASLNKLANSFPNILYIPVTGAHLTAQVEDYLSVEQHEVRHADILICGTSTPSASLYHWMQQKRPDISRIFCDAFHHQSDT